VPLRRLRVVALNVRLYRMVIFFDGKFREVLKNAWLYLVAGDRFLLKTALYN
jgi:hypothetical protein